MSEKNTEAVNAYLIKKSKGEGGGKKEKKKSGAGGKCVCVGGGGGGALSQAVGRTGWGFVGV